MALLQRIVTFLAQPRQPASREHQLPRFEYDTLDEVRDCIRVLTLLPGLESDPICCEFQTVSRAAAVSSFSALSYCWGPEPRVMETIVIRKVVIDEGMDGTKVVDCELRLDVRPNLHKALVALRQGSQEPMRLWIDALCINQTCASEKKDQIRQMADIYSSAINVIIWLGEAADDSDYVMDSISRQSMDEFTTQRFMLGLIAIFSRPWFTRTWIVQEFVLNRASPLMACGFRQMISWEDFKNAYVIAFPQAVDASAIQRLSQPHRSAMIPLLDRWPKCHELYTMLNSFRRGVQSPGPELATYALRYAIYATRTFNATDPRDKIYGILALTHQNVAIEADYEKDVEEVFRDVTIHILQVENSTAIYGFVPLGRSTKSTLPSWVPNYAVSQKDSREKGKGLIISDTVPKHNADGVMVTNCKKRLIVKGQLLDEVHTVVSIPSMNQPPSIWAYPQIVITLIFAFIVTKIPAFKEPVKALGLNGSGVLQWVVKFSTTRSYLIQYSRALVSIERLVTKCAEKFGNLRPTEPLWKLLLLSAHTQDGFSNDEECHAKFEYLMAAVRELAATERPYKWWIINQKTAFLWNRISETSPLSSTIMVTGQGRKFFVGHSGWYGVGEGNVRKGDKLALLFPGANVPFILREKGDCYEMVGPACVPGGMRSLATGLGASESREFTIE